MKTYQTTHGHDLYYESDEQYASYGLSHLSKLSDEEAKVFFDAAHSKGEAAFQDQNGYKFALLYSGDQYSLNAKK